MPTQIRTIWVFILLCTGLTHAQEFTETLKRELQFASPSHTNVLTVQNVNGSIHVEGYNGQTVLVEVRKTITAKSQTYLEKGKREIGIAVEEQGDKLFVYLDSPWTYFDVEKGRFAHHENYNHREKQRYRYHLDFTIKVPRRTGLHLGTMNNGDVFVRDVQGALMKVNNLNGAITLENVAGKTHVSALNRDINITYADNPREDSHYHSLNGDINVTFKGGLDADVTFKSLNGHFYTNYDVVALRPEVTTKKMEGKKGIKYKVDSKESFRIGDGGIQLDFNLLNGDALVKN
ncbi:MAG: DUF4097 family beta strand repeat-containing protein [Flavobacteriaceae bacterium]